MRVYIRFKSLLIIYILFFSSCKDNKNSKLLQTDYLWQLQSYYKNYDKINSKETFEDFLKYLNSNKQNHFNVTNPENFIVKYHNNELVISAKDQNAFKKIETKINLEKDVPFSDKCDYVNEVRIFRNYKRLPKDNLTNEAENHLKNNVDSTKVAIYFNPSNKENSIKKVILFKYREDKVSIVCKKNIAKNDHTLVEKIHTHLEEFIISKNRNFDYALIPVEIIK